MVRPVSVYSVGAVGAAPSHTFGAGVSDAQAPHRPLARLVASDDGGFRRADIALMDDQWLTAFASRSEGGRVRPDDLVSAVDAARELLARRASGLAAYTRWPGDVRADGLLRGSSVAVSVADDLSAQLDRVRSAHETLVSVLARWTGSGTSAAPVGPLRPATRWYCSPTPGPFGISRTTALGFMCWSTRPSASAFSIPPRQAAESGFRFPRGLGPC